jgi:hypothetical protein
MSKVLRPNQSFPQFQACVVNLAAEQKLWHYRHPSLTMDGLVWLPVSCHFLKGGITIQVFRGNHLRCPKKTYASPLWVKKGLAVAKTQSKRLWLKCSYPAHISQGVQSLESPNGRWVDNENMVYIPSGILFSHQEWKPVICGNMHRTGRTLCEVK